MSNAIIISLFIFSIFDVALRPVYHWLVLFYLIQSYPHLEGVGPRGFLERIELFKKESNKSSISLGAKPPKEVLLRKV